MKYNDLVAILSHYTNQVIEKNSRVREDLTLTSFDMMMIVYEIEEKVKREIDMSLFQPGMRVIDLYQIVKGE